MPQTDIQETRVFQIVGTPDQTCQTIRLDGQDQLILTLLRNALFEKATGQKARTPFGPDVDADEMEHLFAHMHSMLDHLSDIRATHFNFVPASDSFAASFLTSEEKSLVQLMHFLRLGKKTEGQTLLLVLCEGGASGAVQKTAHQFVESLSRMTRARTQA